MDKGKEINFMEIKFAKLALQRLEIRGGLSARNTLLTSTGKRTSGCVGFLGTGKSTEDGEI